MNVSVLLCFIKVVEVVSYLRFGGAWPDPDVGRGGRHRYQLHVLVQPV